MRRKRFTEEQIIGILKEADAGAKPGDVCRRHGISEKSYYRWPGGPPILPCASACGSWPPNGGALSIAGCMSCSAAKATASISNGSIACTARKA
jgi:hypothetical protein